MLGSLLLKYCRVSPFEGELVIVTQRESVERSKRFKMSISGKLLIICLSSQNWHHDLWTNKQHIMSRLARRGYSVLHVNKGIKSFLEFAKLKKESYFDTKGISKESENLYLCDSCLLPATRLLKSTIYYTLFGFKINQVLRVIEGQGVSPIIWIYHPGYGHYLERFPKTCTFVYDCVDDYATFPQGRKKIWNRWIKEGEMKVLQKADVVTASSFNLYKKLKKDHRNCHYVHNVGDFNHFNQVDRNNYIMPKVLEDFKTVKIGFFGAISQYKVDLEMIMEIASKNSEYDICLMGPTGVGEAGTNLKKMKGRENIHFLGEIAYQDLPAYLKYMDVIIIPYRITDHTRHVFPIKFFESLATGKPVITTPLPSLEEYCRYVKTCKTSEEFSKAIKESLNEKDPKKKKDRINLAQKHDWASRIDKILELIENATMPPPKKPLPRNNRMGLV